MGMLHRIEDAARAHNDRQELAKKVAQAYTFMVEAMQGEYVARTGRCVRVKRIDETRTRSLFVLDTDSREPVDPSQREAARELAELWREKAGELRGDDACVIVESLKRVGQDPGGVRIAIGNRDGRRVWMPGTPKPKEIEIA